MLGYCRQRVVVGWADTLGLQCIYDLTLSREEVKIIVRHIAVALVLDASVWWRPWFWRGCSGLCCGGYTSGNKQKHTIQRLCRPQYASLPVFLAPFQLQIKRRSSPTQANTAWTSCSSVKQHVTLIQILYCIYVLQIYAAGPCRAVPGLCNWTAYEQHIQYISVGPPRTITYTISTYMYTPLLSLIFSP
jgi:hypothetical protein